MNGKRSSSIGNGSRYSRVKREKVSLCNICRKMKSLTWDHIPPQGGIELTPVEQENVFNRILLNDKNRAFTVSQNGVKFRTICSDCNNNWLGKKYDPALNDFALSVGRLLNGEIHLPSTIQVRARPSAIMRAILGHLLAAKADIDDVVTDNAIREFFFDESLPIPEKIKIFYWIYPYSSIVILRDFAMPAVRGRYENFGVFSFIKYFPVAYLVTDLQAYEGLPELTIFRNMKPNEFTEVTIPLKRIEEPDWPEKVDEGNFILASKSIQSSIYAVPRKRNRRG